MYCLLDERTYLYNEAIYDPKEKNTPVTTFFQYNTEGKECGRRLVPLRTSVKTKLAKRSDKVQILVPTKRSLSACEMAEAWIDEVLKDL